MSKNTTKFNFKILIKDILAGLTTSFAALALGAAFGVQSGRGALAGMIAAAIIPIITSIFGGTRLQASGPTAPMTAVTVLTIAYAYETYGSQTASAEGFVTLVMLMMGLFMMLAALLRLGKLIKLVPNVVILGFMNGIALLIWFDQIKKLLGLGGTVALGGEIWQNVVLAVITLSTILFFPKILEKLKIPEKVRPFIPGTLVTIIALTYFFVFSDLKLQTVSLGASSFSLAQIPEILAKYWPSSPELWNTGTLIVAARFALQLTLLGYLDSLLTSLFIDKMTKEETNQNKELVAQGLANAVSGIFGGIPGAQATIRSVILIKEGAQTRLAGILVGVFTLLGLLIFQQYIALIASSIFVGVLLKAGWDVFEKDFIKDFISQKLYQNRNGMIQFGFVIYTTLVTTFLDLNIAVFSATLFFYLGKKYFAFRDVGTEEESSIEAQM